MHPTLARTCILVTQRGNQECCCWTCEIAYLVQELVEEDVEKPAWRVKAWGNFAHIAREEAGLPKACSSQVKSRASAANTTRLFEPL